MRRRLPWLEIALTVVVLSAYLYAALSDSYNLPNRWFIRDDAYYYFKVAQNISEGHGSTFDGIHPTNGYHPLWMLVCIPIFALARFDLILPLRVLAIVAGLLQAATAILLYRLVRSLLSAPIAVLAAVYWAFDSYILVFLYKTGVESSLALFFILLLLTLAYRLETSWRSTGLPMRQLTIVAVVAALALFSRLDLIFFVMIAGAWMIFRQSALRYLLPLDVLAIVVSGVAAFLVRLGLPGYYDASAAAITMLVLAAAIKIPVFYVLGLYTRPSALVSRSVLIRASIAVAVSSALLSAAMLGGEALQFIHPFPKPALLFDAPFTLALILLIRAAAYLFRAGRSGAEALSPIDEFRSCWRTWLREGAVFYGVVGGSLGIYMLWNKLAFGSFSPVSGQIKRWWGTFLTSVYGGPPDSLLSFFGLDKYSGFSAWQPITSALADWTNPLFYKGRSRLGNPTWDRNFLIILAGAFLIVFAIAVWRRQQARRMISEASIIPLFVGSWLQILSYNAGGYASPKEWYWLTEPILGVLLAAWLLQLLNEMVFQRWAATRVLLWIVVAAYAARMSAFYWRDVIALYPYKHGAAGTSYAEVVPFLVENTQPGAIIGMTGGGNVGYFLPDRTIVNMDGLINSTEYFDDLKAGTGADYLYKTGMRFIFANPELLYADPYRGQYAGRLEAIAIRGGKDLMRLLPNPAH